MLEKIFISNKCSFELSKTLKQILKQYKEAQLFSTLLIIRNQHIRMISEECDIN